MKKTLAVVLTLFLNHQTFSEVRYVQKFDRLSFPSKESKIIYREDNLVIIELPDRRSNLANASIYVSYDAKLHFQLLESFEQFLNYALIFEQNGIKSITRDLRKVAPIANAGDSIRSFTIHVSPDGEAKLLFESSDHFGMNKPNLEIFDEHEVRTIISLMGLLPELKKELSQQKN